MIIRYNGLRLADDRNKGRFADIGEAEQADVGKQLQLKANLPLLAGDAVLCEAGHLTGRGGEVRVAPAAVAALCGDKRFAVGHIRHNRAALGLTDYSAPGHFDYQILAPSAVFAPAGAVFTVGGGVFSLVAEVGERREVVVHLKDYVAASAAVAAVGAARSDIFLSAEAHGAVAAVARLYLDFCNIYKHDFSLFQTLNYIIYYTLRLRLLQYFFRGIRRYCYC